MKRATEVVWIADDGQRFSNKENCIEYEKDAMLYDILRGIITECCEGDDFAFNLQRFRIKFEMIFHKLKIRNKSNIPVVTDD